MGLAQQLLSQNVSHPFRLDGLALTADLSGVPAELQPILTRLRARRSIRLSALGKVSGKAVVDGTGFVKDLGDLIWDGLTGNIRDTVTNAIWTRTAEALNFHYGTGVELDEILNELLGVQSDLASLIKEVDTAQLTSAWSAVNATTQAIDTLTTDQTKAAETVGYVNTLGGSSLSGFRTEDPNDAIGTFNTAIGSYEAGKDLRILQNYSLGLNSNTNLITETASFLANRWGFDQPTRFAAFPLRCNGVTDDFTKTQKYLESYQQLSLNYLAESSQTGLEVAGKVTSAEAQLSRTLELALQARQQTPVPLLSEYILVDLENGLMWSLQAHDEDTYAGAQSTANAYAVNVSNFTLGHWRLPSKNECISLQQRGRYVSHALWSSTDTTPINSNTGDADTGCSLRGLATLGFTGLDNFDSKGNIWYADYKSASVNNVAVWQLTENQEFYLNLQNNNTNGEDSSKKRPFLLCRSLGTDTVLLPGDYGYDNRGNTIKPASNVPGEWTMEAINAQEFPSLGAPTSIGNESLSTTNVTVTNSSTNTTSNVSIPILVAPMSYRVNLGGSFQYTSAEATGSGLMQNLAMFYSASLSNGSSISLPSISPGNSTLTVRNTASDHYGQVQFKNAGASPLAINASVTLEHIGGVDPATGFYPVRLSTSSTVSGTATPRALQGLLILPGNLNYNLASGASKSQLFQVLAYYDDESLSDVTLVCNLTSDNTGATFVNANPYMQLNMPASLGSGVFHVTAKFGTLTNTTAFSITRTN